MGYRTISNKEPGGLRYYGIMTNMTLQSRVKEKKQKGDTGEEIEKCFLKSKGNSKDRSEEEKVHW